MRDKKKLAFVIVCLCIIGLLMVYSSSHVVAVSKFNDAYYYVKRQIIFMMIGFVFCYLFSKADYHIYQKISFKFLILTLVLLILVLIPGIGVIRGGSRSWFSLGVFSFQPSELYKCFIIMHLSHYFSKHYHQTKKLKTSIYPLFFILLGFGIIMLQPDFGSGVVSVASSVFLLFLTSFPIGYFLIMGLIFVGIAFVLILIAPYRLIRLLSFLDPFSDPLGSGFQSIQSMYAIGPGGLLGVGFGNNIQKHFYLPEPQTDFIFSIYAGEFGFIGCAFLLFLFFMFFYLSFKIASKSKDLFGYYLGCGIAILITFQTIINLGVVSGLFPVTGETPNSERSTG